MIALTKEEVLDILKSVSRLEGFLFRFNPKEINSNSIEAEVETVTELLTKKLLDATNGRL
jgi:hypothetical protein